MSVIFHSIEHFEGSTYVPELDGQRLTTQLERVRALMMDGQWRTLAEIGAVVLGTEASLSARLRDLRKRSKGAHSVERRRIIGGLFEYRLIPRQADLIVPEHFGVRE